MAVAAFKSSSRRPNITSKSHSAGKESTEKENPQKKAAPIRRSRSVSAFSRRTVLATNNDEISEFLNKRDNPLFWSSGVGSGSPPKSDATNTNARTAADDTRGRSATKGTWVDPGRRNRSVSRRRCVTSESEAEQECGSSKDLKNWSNWNVVSSNGKKGGLVGSSSGFEPSDGLATNLSCLKTQSWEDGVLTSSSLGAEEKTIKACCEQMKPVQGDNVEGDDTASGIYETVRSEVRRAVSEIQNDLEIAIRRSNATAIATTNIADIPPDLVNPAAVELVLDIRREYAKKLEQSLERAGKLRADLAVEEHRGYELSRILKEILPDPKTPNVQKSRPGRKSSIERRKMSKRLEEEAMTYFDECVSLSTFDSSDFSSPEDPPLDLATPVSYSATLPQARSGTPAATFTKSSFNTKKESDIQSRFMNSHDASGPTASSNSKEGKVDPVSPNSDIAEKGSKFQFSFADKTTETFNLQQDLRKYIRNFEKHDIDLEIARSNCYNMDEYNLQDSAESLLFDRVIFRNRIESDKSKPKRSRKIHISEKCQNANGPSSAVGRRSSVYRGVTRHRWTGRFEAHLWDKSSWNNIQNKKGRQGAYDNEEAAAHTYDLAALKYWGPGTTLNFPIETYTKELEEMQNVTKEEYLASLRRRSSGFSRGVSKYRGVARHHHNGRWEARIGRVFGNKYLYLGTYNTQEEAAAAYDMAAIEYRGANAVTNFDISNYIDRLKKEIPGINTHSLTKSESLPILQQQQPKEPKEEKVLEQLDHYNTQLPSCMDTGTMEVLDPWSFLDTGFAPLPVPDLPIEKPCELTDLFDHKAFEDDIHLIFEAASNQDDNAKLKTGADQVGASRSLGDDNVQENRLLLLSSSTSSPSSSTTSVSCIYSA